jgi:hypothetical protein
LKISSVVKIGNVKQQDGHFIEFIKQQRKYIWLTLVIAVSYLILIRSLYPIPSFFSDSFTFVGAAAHNHPVSFRPVMYSKLIQFFKTFSTSDIALVAAQYISTVLANLFLFLTSCWLFGLRRWLKYLLFVLLICHPFYVFSCNYVSSDAFFTSGTVLWFTTLFWIMYKPTWYLIILHLGLLAMLFLLRYNAVYFPLFTTMAVLFSNVNWWKKLAAITAAIVLVATCIEVTSTVTKRYAKTKVFSPFAGWQLANNALHVVRNERIDPQPLKDPDVKKLLLFSQHHFDTSREYVPVEGTAWYMWHPNSPLKEYMRLYAPKANYFKTWVALGPLYQKFGVTIILHHPVGYIKHFVVPNTSEYIYPQLEVYEKSMEGLDTVAAVAQRYYKYPSNKAPAYRPLLQRAVFAHWPLLFTCANILLVSFGGWYFLSKRFKMYLKLVNRFIVLFSLFFAANFCFIVLLAPSVFRYHLPILLLSFPVILFLISACAKTSYSKDAKMR